MAQSIQFASEFNLDACKIYSHEKEVFADISDTVISIDISENIFQSSVEGIIVVGDANNLIENMPKTGQEYLDLKISTPGATQFEHIIDFTGDRGLFIYDISNRQELSAGSQVYVLKVSSIEPLRNQNIRISKSYTKTVSEIVRDILKNTFETSKKLFIEKTKGIRRIVVPNNHPFTIINQLKAESISQKYNTPHYLFFENKHGFHFRSLQHLMSKDKDHHYRGIVIQKVLHAGDKNLDEDKGPKGSTRFDTTTFQSFMRIQSYSFENINNWYTNNHKGILGSTLFTHDIYTKTYKKETFDYFDNFYKNSLQAKTKPLYNQNILKKDFGTFENSRIFVHPVSRVGTSITDKDAQYYQNDKTLYDTSAPEEFILDRQSKMSELVGGGISINMIINGTTDIAAGDMAYVSLPIVGVNHNNEPFERSTSGNYLITHLRHSFIPTTQQHKIHLRATKDNRG